MDIHNHPCFNPDVRHTTGRIHLPVAPHCNVQCNFCNRKFDCVNESRPGVSTTILKPQDAVAYLEKIDKQVANLAVVGIAGPGDPFANPVETLETLVQVHNRFPEKLLCISSNGLRLPEYVDHLARLNVSHVTITVNAVDPNIGAQIYEWVYFDKKTYHGVEGATLLLNRQTEAIRLLKQRGITVKINTVVIPRINEHHVPEVARYVAALGADVQNCIPLIPVPDTPFGELDEPLPSSMRTIRAQTSVHIKQMAHCARCRADAIGLLGQDTNLRTEELLAEAKNLIKLPFSKRPYIAVTTSDGETVNKHLGVAPEVWLYSFQKGRVICVGRRSLPPYPTLNRWEVIADQLKDCSALLVKGVGRIPLEVLTRKGLFVEAVYGPVEVLVESLFVKQTLPPTALRLAGHCGTGATCSGKASGCL